MDFVLFCLKTNFFEREVGEYQKANIGNSVEDNSFGFVDEF